MATEETATTTGAEARPPRTPDHRVALPGSGSGISPSERFPELNLLSDREMVELSSRWLADDSARLRTIPGGLPVEAMLRRAHDALKAAMNAAATSRLGEVTAAAIDGVWHFVSALVHRDRPQDGPVREATIDLQKRLRAAGAEPRPPRSPGSDARARFDAVSEALRPDDCALIRRAGGRHVVAQFERAGLAQQTTIAAASSDPSHVSARAGWVSTVRLMLTLLETHPTTPEAHACFRLRVAQAVLAAARARAREGEAQGIRRSAARRRLASYGLFVSTLVLLVAVANAQRTHAFESSFWEWLGLARTAVISTLAAFTWIGLTTRVDEVVKQALRVGIDRVVVSSFIIVANLGAATVLFVRSAQMHHVRLECAEGLRNIQGWIDGERQDVCHFDGDLPSQAVVAIQADDSFPLESRWQALPTITRDKIEYHELAPRPIPAWRAIIGPALSHPPAGSCGSHKGGPARAWEVHVLPRDPIAARVDLIVGLAQDLERRGAWAEIVPGRGDCPYRYPAESTGPPRLNRVTLTSACLDPQRPGFDLVAVICNEPPSSEPPEHVFNFNTEIGDNHVLDPVRWTSSDR